MSHYAHLLFCLVLLCLVLPRVAYAGKGMPANVKLVLHNDPAVQYNRIAQSGSHDVCSRKDGTCNNAWWVESNGGDFQELSRDDHTTLGPTASLSLTFSGSKMLILGGKRNPGKRFTATIDGAGHKMEDASDGIIFYEDGLDPSKTHTFRLDYSGDDYFSVVGFALDKGARTGGAPAPAPAPPAPPPASPPSNPPAPVPPHNPPPTLTPTPTQNPAPGGGEQLPTASVPPASPPSTPSSSAGVSSGGSSTDPGSGDATGIPDPGKTTSAGPSTATAVVQHYDHSAPSNGESGSPTSSDGVGIPNDGDGDGTSFGGPDDDPSTGQVPSGGGGSGGKRSNGGIIGGAVAGGLLLLILLLLLAWYVRRWIRARRAPSYAFRNGAAGFEIVNYASTRPESSVPDSWEPFPEFPSPPHSEMAQTAASGPVGIAV